MITVEIQPGGCDQETIIVAYSEDNQKVNLDIASKCPAIQKAAEELRQLDASTEVFGPAINTTIYKVMAKYARHPSCPVASGVLKAIEATVGLAPPVDVHMRITES